MATLLQFGPSSPICRGPSPSDMFQFSLTPKQSTATTAGSSSNLHDIVVNTPTGSAHNVFQPTLSDSIPYPGTTLVNNNSAVVTGVSPGVVATWVADGVASVTATNPRLGSQTITYNVNTTSAYNVFTGYNSGSLAYAMGSAIDGALSGKSWSSSTVTMFSSITGTTSATRNASLWCSSLFNLTGVPFARSTGGVSVIGCLVSPNHVIGCNHSQMANGTVLYWWGSDSAVHSAQILSSGNVSGTDIQVYYLGSVGGGIAINSAVPVASVQPFSVMPTNFALAGTSYLSSLNQSSNLPRYAYAPVVYSNQFQEVLPVDLTSYPASGDFSVAGCAQTTPVNRSVWSQSPAAVASSKTYTYAPINGDSGLPIFTVVPGDATLTPVLLGNIHTAGAPQPGAGAAPTIGNYATQVNTLMRSLASAASGGTDTTAYALTVASLGAFPTYT